MQYTENTGAFLSLGESLPEQTRFWLFIVVGFLLLAAITIYAYRITFQYRYKIAGLSIIVGGGVSNLIDRITNHGAVIDFLNIGIGVVRTGIFNIADFLILIGIAFVLIFHSHQSEYRHH
jgi:signal peptidase II